MSKLLTKDGATPVALVTGASRGIGAVVPWPWLERVAT